MAIDDEKKRAAEETLKREAAKEHGIPIVKIYEWAMRKEKEQQKQETPDR